MTAADALRFVEANDLAERVAALVDDAPPLPRTAEPLVRALARGGGRRAAA